MLSKHYLDALPSTLTNETYPKILKGLKGEKQSFEISCIFPDGELHHNLVHYLPDIDNKLQVKGLFALGFDITYLKNTEQKLKLSEKALQSSHEGIFITDEQHRIIYANEGFTNISGYTLDEALGQKASLLKSCNQNDNFFINMNEKIHSDGFFQGEITNQHKNGSEYAILMTIDSIKNDAGKITNYVASIINITESNKIKQKLELSSAMLKRTGKIANVGGWEYDWHTQTIVWTDQMFAIHEIENEQVPDLESAILFYLPEARETVQNAVEVCIKNGIPWNLELPFITAKGQHKWVRTIGELITINGVKIKLAGTCQDITEQKIQELETRARELNLRNGLVREVHHHIKNNIQGISGLLFNAADEHPLLAEHIHKAISKLNSVAVIHGLQGKDIETQIELGELAFAIVSNFQSIWQTHVQFIKPNPWAPCYLEKNEAVPIALILNEIITNAHKHGKNDDELDDDIEIRLTQIGGDVNKNEVHINITNSGELKNTKNEKTSNLNQAGLKLVYSLMPKSGAYLGFVSEHNKTQVKLTLNYPIVNFSKPLSL